MWYSLPARCVRCVACPPKESVRTVHALVAGWREGERKSGLERIYIKLQSTATLLFFPTHVLSRSRPLLPGVRAKITCVTAGRAAGILTARPCE